MTLPPPSTGAPPSSRRAGREGSSRSHAPGPGASVPPPSTGAPPSSRRAGLRKVAFDTSPPSAPPVSEGQGQVQRLVAWCDAHKGAFFISLLIMQTGIKLREFDGTARDDRAVLAKLWPALDVLLTSAELDDLRRTVR